VASKRRKRTGPPPRQAPRPHRPRRTTGPATKAQQLAAAAQRKKQARRRQVVIALLLLAAVAAVAAYVVTSRRADDSLRQALTAGSCDVDTESDEISGGDGHVTSPSYTVDPPAGGDHLASVARGGVYAGDAVPPEGELVHALEHGYVVAWHAPDLPAEQVEQLAAFEQRHDGDVIVAEREGMSTPVAATAWGQRLLCGEVEPDALDRFAEEHVGNGPEDVERG
jgi:hypothetical protein